MANIAEMLDQETKNSIKLILSFIGKFLRFFLIFSLIPIACAVYYGFKKYEKENDRIATYTAKYVFIESSKISASPAAGIDIPFRVSGSNSGNDTGIIQSIFQSDEVIGRALFSPISPENDTLLINFFIQEYYPEMDEANYFVQSSLDSLSLKQKALYKRTVGRMLKTDDPILSFSQAGTNSLLATSSNEKLSLALVENVYSSLQEFYDGNSDKTFSKRLNQLTSKRDSTFALKKYYQQKISNSETSSFIKLPNESVSNILDQERLSIVTEEYLKYHSQVEQLKLSEDDETYFRTLNYPIEPLYASKKQVFKETLTGGVIGFAIGIFLIIFLFILFEFIKLIRAL